jgi:hypothetical protein
MKADECEGLVIQMVCKKRYVPTQSDLEGGHVLSNAGLGPTSPDNVKIIKRKYFDDSSCFQMN